MGMVPFLITRYTKIKFLWFVYFLISLAILIHISGYVQGRYLNIPNWDTIAHTVSGSIIALLGFVAILFVDRMRKYNLDPLSMACFAFMFGLVGEYLWEIYEFLVDTFLGGSLAGKMQADNTDTMMDMLFVLIPSVLVALGTYYYLNKYGKETRAAAILGNPITGSLRALLTRVKAPSEEIDTMVQPLFSASSMQLNVSSVLPE
jgi:hypothetical protein